MWKLEYKNEVILFTFKAILSKITGFRVNF